MIKKIVIITILTSIAHTDVSNRMKSTYNPMYNYSYSYSRLISMNNYGLKYIEMKKEHKKVVRILNNANKTIETLEYKNQTLKKNLEYWKNRATKKVSPNDKIKRTEALKRMREQLKVK